MGLGMSLGVGLRKGEGLEGAQLRGACPGGRNTRNERGVGHLVGGLLEVGLLPGAQGLREQGVGAPTPVGAGPLQ